LCLAVRFSSFPVPKLCSRPRGSSRAACFFSLRDAFFPFTRTLKPFPILHVSFFASFFLIAPQITVSVGTPTSHLNLLIFLNKYMGSGMAIFLGPSIWVSPACCNWIYGLTPPFFGSLSFPPVRQRVAPTVILTFLPSSSRFADCIDSLLFLLSFFPSTSFLIVHHWVTRSFKDLPNPRRSSGSPRARLNSRQSRSHSSFPRPYRKENLRLRGFLSLHVAPSLFFAPLV